MCHAETSGLHPRRTRDPFFGCIRTRAGSSSVNNSKVRFSARRCALQSCPYSGRTRSEDCTAGFSELRTRSPVSLYNQQRLNQLQSRAAWCRRRRMVDRKRSPIVVWIVPVLVGLAGFYRVMQSPTFAAYRAVDVVQLLGSGVCFGAAMVGIIFRLRGSPS